MFKARGFDVLTTLEARRLGRADRAQLEFAVIEGRVLVTHNRVHFERLAKGYFDLGGSPAGIIAVRRPSRQLLVRLLQVLDRLTADEFSNQRVYV